MTKDNKKKCPYQKVIKAKEREWHTYCTLDFCYCNRCNYENCWKYRKQNNEMPYFFPSIVEFWYIETDIECALFCPSSAEGFDRPAKCRYCYYNHNDHSNYVRCHRNWSLPSMCPDWNVVQEHLEEQRYLRNIVCPRCFTDNIFRERKNKIYGCYNCKTLFQVQFKGEKPVRYFKLWKIDMWEFIRKYKWTPLEDLKEIYSEQPFLEV